MTETDGYAHLRELMEVRFEGNDRAIKLLEETTRSQPTPGVLEERLIALKELVDSRFRELEVRTTALAVSNQKSIDLALQAAKEAAAKSENAFNKQIDAQSVQMTQGLGSIADKVNGIDARVTRIESSNVGSKQSYGNVMSVISVIVSIAAVLILASTKFAS